jgi:hypothetical protein
VKLKEQPSLVELTRQVELINNSFEDICNSGKNLTIRLQKVLPDTADSNKKSSRETTPGKGGQKREESKHSS